MKSETNMVASYSNVNQYAARTLKTNVVNYLVRKSASPNIFSPDTVSAEGLSGDMGRWIVGVRMRGFSGEEGGWTVGERPRVVAFSPSGSSLCEP